MEGTVVKSDDHAGAGGPTVRLKYLSSKVSEVKIEVSPDMFR